MLYAFRQTYFFPIIAAVRNCLSNLVILDYWTNEGMQFNTGQYMQTEEVFPTLTLTGFYITSHCQNLFIGLSLNETGSVWAKFRVSLISTSA